jgi:autophagy-related protein 2
MLANLPVELQHGSIASITARVPWPNPLTSVIGLSVQSFHLTFHIIDDAPRTKRFTSQPHALSESVASVADTFLHDELNRIQEAELRQSLRSATASPKVQENIPGGLDPFVTDEPLPQDEIDLEEVTVFSSLVEHLLARFQFDAVATTITLVKPGVASFTLNVGEIRSNSANETAQPPSAGKSKSSTSVEQPPAQWVEVGTRKVLISGVSLSTHSLRPDFGPLRASPTLDSPSAASSLLSQLTGSTSTTIPQDAGNVISEQVSSPDLSVPVASISNIGLGRHSPVRLTPPTSPSTSDSDMDEEAQMYMSQSIIGLPPQGPSPTSSVASSMYESALSLSPYGVSDPTTPSPIEGPLVSRSNLQEADDSVLRMADSAMVQPELPRPASFDPTPSVPAHDTLSHSRSPSPATTVTQQQTIMSFGSEDITISISTPRKAPALEKQASSSRVYICPSRWELLLSHSVPAMSVIY